MHCTVCHGEIKGGHGWRVAGQEERYAHPDCHRLAFDTDPVQRVCEMCGRSVWLTSVPTVTIRGVRLHTVCAIYSAPSAKAGMMVN